MVMSNMTNISISPEQMAARAAEFDQCCDEFNVIITNMRSKVQMLSEEWSGMASAAFAEQFQSLEPGFNATSNLISSIAAQLRGVAAAMQDADSGIAGKIGSGF